MRYYLVAVDSDDGQAVFVEPAVFADRDEAAKRATHKIGLADAGVRPGLIAGLEYRFLLDTGSVDLDDREQLLRLLHTDPLLHAIFQIGRNVQAVHG